MGRGPAYLLLFFLSCVLRAHVYSRSAVPYVLLSCCICCFCFCAAKSKSKKSKKSKKDTASLFAALEEEDDAAEGGWLGHGERLQAGV